MLDGWSRRFGVNTGEIPPLDLQLIVYWQSRTFSGTLNQGSTGLVEVGNNPFPRDQVIIKDIENVESDPNCKLVVSSKEKYSNIFSKLFYLTT